MFQINNNVHENTINFLYQAATVLLPKANPSLKLLKSYYINKTRDIARCENLTIPNKTYGPAAMCQKCSVPWGEGTCKLAAYSTKPKNIKSTNFITIRRKKSNAKNYKKYLILKCSVCKSRTKQTLSKSVITEAKPQPQLRNIATTESIKLNTPLQRATSINKPPKKKINKAASNKSIQKSKKPNQSHILQLAKLLSSSTNRSTIVSHEDKLKQFLK